MAGVAGPDLIAAVAEAGGRVLGEMPLNELLESVLPLAARLFKPE